MRFFWRVMAMACCLAPAALVACGDDDGQANGHNTNNQSNQNNTSNLNNNAQAECNNGVIETGESCDGTQLGDATCDSVRPGSVGTLSCTVGCEIDSSLCALCGDGVEEPGEECDCGDNPSSLPAGCDDVNGGTNANCDASCNDIVSSECLPTNPNAPGDNPCGDGFYQDLSASPPDCKSLDRPDLGFDCAEFLAALPAATATVTTCTESAVRTALASLEPAGGTLNLPDCTFEITSPFRIGEGGYNYTGALLLQGHGREDTVIQWPSGQGGGHMLDIWQERNVVVRDLAVQGRAAPPPDADAEPTPLIIRQSTNILVERVELANGLNVVFNNSLQVTWRYVVTHGHWWHGINSKDCPVVGSCTPASGPHGVFPTQDYAIYSVEAYDGATTREGNGIDSHASIGEIAGNYIHDFGKGMKFPETEQLWIHNNVFDNTPDYGLRIYGINENPFVALGSSEHYPHDHAIYDNVFLNQSCRAVHLSKGAEPTINRLGNVWLLHNDYDATCEPEPVIVQDTNPMVSFDSFSVCTVNNQDLTKRRSWACGAGSAYDPTTPIDCSTIDPSTLF